MTTDEQLVEEKKVDACEKLNVFCKRRYLAFVFFLILCFDVYCKFLSWNWIVLGYFFDIDKFIEDYEISLYLLNYSDGFSRRMLIGTIYQFLAGGVISKEFVVFMNGIVLLIADILVCVLLCHLVCVQQKKNYKFVTLFFSFLLFVLPSMSIFVGQYVARLDVHMLLLSLLSILCIHVGKFKDFRYVLVCLLQITAMLVHPGYAFTYYVPVFIALVWSVIEDDFSKKSIVLSVVLCVIPVVLGFFYIQYFTSLKYDTLEELLEVFSYRTNGNFDKNMPALEFFGSSMKECWGYTPLERFTEKFPRMVLMAVKLFPFWGLLYMFWHKVFVYTKDKKKIIAYALMHAAFLVYIPLFLLAIDYGRWMTSLCVGGLFNLYMLLYHKTCAVEQAMDEMYMILRKYYLLFLLLCFYLACIPIFGIHI